jgi:hypothetical protein
MADHTPGPWITQIPSEDSNGIFVKVVDAQDVTVADVPQQPYDTWQATDNARLIAAAPELLRIVKTLCEYADVGRLVCEGANVDYAVLDEAIGAARDAIATIEEV